MRSHIAQVATALFAERGFDDVSVSEIAEVADVSRPTVFAYFARKEDLVFDRVGSVTAVITTTVDDAGTAPVRAVCDLLASPGAPGGLGAAMADQINFWRLVAGSRALKARARELAEEMEAALAASLSERGVREPSLSAALIAAGYRSVHLHAIRRLLDGDPPGEVDAERSARLTRALAAVEVAIAALQGVP